VNVWFVIARTNAGKGFVFNGVVEIVKQKGCRDQNWQMFGTGAV